MKGPAVDMQAPTAVLLLSICRPVPPTNGHKLSHPPQRRRSAPTAEIGFED